MNCKTTYWFLILILVLSASCSEPTLVLKTQKIDLENPDQIVAITDSLVAPNVYQNIPSFERLTVDESKEKFIWAVLPAILVAKHYIKKDRDQILMITTLDEEWTPEDSAFYEKQLDRFKASSTAGLLKKMETHPNSIVIAQAAVESGWGSSRFFQEANNLFGVWSYKSSEPRVLASSTSGESAVYLRKYSDISTSIEDYFETIGRSRAYRQFRNERSKTDDVNALLPLLRNYSERKDEYIAQLATIIRQNDLMRYDHYRLDPKYFVEP